MRPRNPSSTRLNLSHPISRRKLFLPTRLYRLLSPHLITLTALFATALLTTIYLHAIRANSVELSFDQLSAFERQVQTVGNRTVYLTEAGKRDDMLSTLARDDWARVSSRVDYVAFVYGDAADVLRGPGWVALVADQLQQVRPKGYGVVLFSCGCVLPNAVFTETKTRFMGFECVMLPGFVIGKDAVRFVNVSIAEEGCVGRERVLGLPWYREWSWKLEDARREHEELRAKLEQDGS